MQPRIWCSNCAMLSDMVKGKDVLSDRDAVIAANVKHFRDKAAMSQQQLADAMTAEGVAWSKRIVWAVEAEEPNVRRPLRASEAVVLAEILGVEPTALTTPQGAYEYFEELREHEQAVRRMPLPLADAWGQAWVRLKDAAVFLRDTESAHKHYLLQMPKGAQTAAGVRAELQDAVSRGMTDVLSEALDHALNQKRGDGVTDTSPGEWASAVASLDAQLHALQREEPSDD